jgi:peptidoglycan/xylan/chitin deacetylase (PgdA/CDA1 family)
MRRLTRPIRSRKDRGRPFAVLLIYHRVAEPSLDSHYLAVSPGNFARHLEYLRGTCHPISLLDLVDCLGRGSLPDRSVVLTFDDGYVDNLRYAAPLLESARVPATVFAASGYTGGDREFWWDALEEMLLLNPRVPEHLELRFDGEHHRWRLRHQKDRRRAHAEIHHLLRELEAGERDEILAHLGDRLGGNRRTREDCRPMTAAELRRLTESGLIDLGAHTVNHSMLSNMQPEAQRDEIAAARETLESLTGRPVLVHAHPFGNFGDDTVRIIQELGFSAACTGSPGRVQESADAFRLPRNAVMNWGGAAFRRCLEDFFHGESPR